jgi:hypothetical protein
MKIEINVTDSFKKAAKPLIKKYRSFLDDLLELESELLRRPQAGKSLGNNVYKVRLGIRANVKVRAAELELSHILNGSRVRIEKERT